MDEIELHGHRVSYRRAGEGPVVVLIHGIAGTSATWDQVIPRLAEQATVIAPDLPGHGASGSSAGDYSIGAMAATVRDLLVALGLESATIVGHSLGGGVAMQFSYLFPQETARLVLISSGGLGRSVNLILGSAALPGAELVTAALGTTAQLGDRLIGRLLRRTSLGSSPSAAELGRSVTSLGDSETRRAFHATLRAVVGARGQRVFAGDRLYLAEEMPTLILWGQDDAIIPVGHGRRAHAAMPGSRFEVREGVGHFPPVEDADWVVEHIERFLRDTEPAASDPSRFAELLRRGEVA